MVNNEQMINSEQGMVKWADQETMMNSEQTTVNSEQTVNVEQP